MTEDELARKVVSSLNDGLRQVQPEVSARLAQARHLALSQAEYGKPVWGLAWSTGRGGPHAGSHHGPGLYRVWVPLAVIFALVSALAYWQTPSHDHEAAEIDAALLADDLPVHAYTDTGFGTWLRPSSD
jgi:hypothetical protein